MSDLATDRFCPGCGYDLRGITSERCPECGTPFDPNQPTEPQIPWSHRATLGRRKAFWRTVKLATFRTKQFAAEINRPVSLADALSFRRVVALHVFIIIGLPLIAGYLEMFEMFQRPWVAADEFGSIAQWVGLPIMLASLWLFWLFVFGLPSYFFHPRHLPIKQQNRAVALSYYACAPWAYSFILPILAAIVALVAILSDPRWGAPVLAIGLIWAIALAPLVLWFLKIWLVPQQMLTVATRCSGLRWALMGFVYRPIAFVFCLLLTVGAMNGTYWLGILIVHTFR